MTVQLLSPEGMFQPVPYHHVSIGTGTRHVHVAGQIARDGEGNRIAPGDLAGQVVQSLRNTARGLAGAGATFSDVVRLRFFATDWSPEKYDAFIAGIERATEELGIPRPLPPASLIGVDYLFEPDVLVEVEAFAVLD
ncbi:Enamine deaminase RidA, house cleaning of reactive enamine intermediates, YjgF/YER057c/UK114 family [Marinactinospora thermotolerans DSM 45154]|uniref:Enamine deaminase RidA, house cleaning of reactive enamine intermediates, YjgF/YER057c/UK114 family n=1 Tax=Marinactinospora thermotolerans DSM 45154 TaxID=1122192 RepID=A0A1T4MUW2_9ACTN|nr:Rid family hydrolase [Marinactinospora thermotolerans]SJZ70565.1 Enamine deaminase RidA, house cleaning of reactive enamine intermediates, YjgF/YER057c/UK114 family [Marinactinospora thermotolerans DSM 45154]